MNLTGRTVLITGGASGIGLALATALAKKCERVIVTGRDSTKLNALVQAHPELAVIQSDVADPNQIARLRDEALRRFPKLDVLINNAGIMRNLALAESRDLMDLTREVDVLLSGPMRMVQAFLPHLLARDAAAIVNVSSGLAFVPLAASPIYSAAKAGLRAYTRSLRAQLAASRVEVIELAPPPVETELFRGEFAEEMQGEKAMSPQLLVQKAIAGIERGEVEIAPGIARVLRLASRLAPELMFRQLAKSERPKFRAALANSQRHT